MFVILLILIESFERPDGIPEEANWIPAWDFTQVYGDWTMDLDDSKDHLFVLYQGGILEQQITCSRFWIIGMKDSNFDTIDIYFGQLSQLNINCKSDVRQKWQVFFDSQSMPITTDNLIIQSRSASALHGLFYLYDPPSFSPSRSPSFSPSLSPSFSPSLTPTITPDPFCPVPRIVKINQSEAIILKHCKFSNIKSYEPGGIIFTQNCILQIYNCQIFNISGGGAIYWVFN